MVLMIPELFLLMQLLLHYFTPENLKNINQNDLFSIFIFIYVMVLMTL